MLAGVVAGLLVAFPPLPKQQKDAYVVYLGDPALPSTRLSFTMWEDKLPEPKLSPKSFGDPPVPYQFEWLVAGAGRPKEQYEARFLVFSQERKATGDKAQLVVRQMLRQWGYLFEKLGSDHNKTYDNGIVSVYLCWGGKPGGEQLFGEEHRKVVTKRDNGEENTRMVDVKVNTIYIYDLNSFKDPVEMAREVAHEYGHAVLPPVGGFKDPEDWGNGYLGEKLFLRWLRNDLKAGKIETMDTMTASVAELDDWVKKNADPLEAKIAVNGPELGLLEGQGQGAMNEYIGLNLLMETILPPKVFAMAIRDTGSTQAKDFSGALVRTVENWPTGVVLSVPAAYKKGLWIPVGKCKVAGATVTQRKGDWQHIVPGASVVTLVPPKL